MPVQKNVITVAKERYASACDAWRQQRERSAEDFRFSNPADPQQWDQRVRQAREQSPDGARPCLTFDHTNQYIQQVVNDARQNKPAINYMPASGGAVQQVADALDGMARHIEYQSRAQIAYDTAIDHSARGGIGWIRVLPEVVDAELNYQEIRIQRVADPMSVVPDPDWQEPDGSDMRWCFIESLMTRDEYKRRYGKDAKDTSWGQRYSRDSGGMTAGDKVMVCEYFERVETVDSRIVATGRDGVRKSYSEDEYWQQAQADGVAPIVSHTYAAKVDQIIWRTISGDEVLEETTFPSRLMPVVPVIGHELWIDGKRYLCGMVRRMREAQQAYNYERSAWVEAIALQPKAPWVIAAEAIEGHEAEWGRANKANLAYLPWNAYSTEGAQLPMPQRGSVPQIPAAFAQGAMQADSDIQASIGMYRASLGAPTSEHSGRAILAKQREGDTANFHLLDNQSRSIERVGRIVLDMIPRIYDEPREARILGDDGTSKAVRIDVNAAPYSIDGDVETINPSTGQYSVRVKAGPSYTTLRQEAADGLTTMMQGNPGVAAVVAPIWARMQDWPEADKLSKALLSMAPPPVQQALGESGQQPGDDSAVLRQQLQQQEQQLQQMHQMLDQAAAKLQELQADAKAKQIEQIAKAAELEIREYEAETNRLKVLGAGMTPEQVHAIASQAVMQAMQREPLDEGDELERMAGMQEQSAPAQTDDTTDQQEAPNGI